MSHKEKVAEALAKAATAAAILDVSEDDFLFFARDAHRYAKKKLKHERGEIEG